MPEFDSTSFTSIDNIQKQFSMPAIVGWNRLEPRPRTADFDRSLKAEIRDALWMLSRQWQMGEFKGEDGGSPVGARLLTEEYSINRYAPAGSKAISYNDSIPLEAQVETETIPDSWQLKIQASTQFFKLLAKQAFDADQKERIREQYKITEISDTESLGHILCNQPSAQLYDQASLRSIDGYRLLTEIASGDFATWLDTSDSSLSDADKTTLKTVGSSLLDWFRRLYHQPTGDTAWKTPCLEYQFNCAAPAAGGNQTVLKAEQYASGHLDWYAFDIDSSVNSLEDDPSETITDAAPTEKLVSFIPTNISFGGMPNARYWEMEDRKTDFGDIDTNTTDIAKLMVAEFGLIYSNDWFIIPYGMNTGNICSIGGMVVTDTFGERTLIRAAGEGTDNDWQSWRLYNLSTSATAADNRLFLAPAAVKVMESEALEKLNIIRDEMANMVWAIENTITLPSGKPRSGYEAAREFSSYLSQGYSSITDDLAAAVKYTLGTSVPENWIPFLSVHTAGSDRDIQMQRAAMPRTSDGSNDPAGPRTTLLAGDEPFYIHEEEVPRSGTMITQTYQRTRWYNGKTLVWLGRKVTNGKGEGNSGLRFDQLNDIKTGE
jgi:hypothetical protein